MLNLTNVDLVVEQPEVDDIRRPALWRSRIQDGYAQLINTES